MLQKSKIICETNWEEPEPFFHLVSEQLMIQPPIIRDPEKLEMTPNAGRKVLLFSDSRQRAATLAKELTDVADEDAMRKAIVVAARMLCTSGKRRNKKNKGNRFNNRNK